MRDRYGRGYGDRGEMRGQGRGMWQGRDGRGYGYGFGCDQDGSDAVLEALNIRALHPAYLAHLAQQNSVFVCVQQQDGLGVKESRMVAADHRGLGRGFGIAQGYGRAGHDGRKGQGCGCEGHEGHGHGCEDREGRGWGYGRKAHDGCEGHEDHGHGCEGHDGRGHGCEDREGRGWGYGRKAHDGQGCGCEGHEGHGHGCEGHEGHGRLGRDGQGCGSEGHEGRGHGCEAHEGRGRAGRAGRGNGYGHGREQSNAHNDSSKPLQILSVKLPRVELGQTSTTANAAVNATKSSTPACSKECHTVADVAAGLCTGCGDCVALCGRRQAISMQTNDAGDLVPVVDMSLCNLCGKCYRKCPAILETQSSQH